MRTKSKEVVSHHQDLITVRQLAHSWHMAEKTLYAWVCSHRIPFVKVGRCVRFDLQEINTWLETENKKVKSEQFLTKDLR